MTSGFDQTSIADAAHFGTIVVYRHWKLWRVSRRELTLIGIAMPAAWRDEWNTATCRSDPFNEDEADDRDEHPVVVPGCGCGYWGYWLPRATVLTVPQAAPSVFGAVEVAGRIRVGDLGLRAERARILGLAAMHDTAELLRENYPSTTVYGDAHAVIDAHPPIDTTSLLGQSAEGAFVDYVGSDLSHYRQVMTGRVSAVNLTATLTQMQRALGYRPTATSTARVHARRPRPRVWQAGVWLGSGDD